MDVRWNLELSDSLHAECTSITLGNHLANR